MYAGERKKVHNVVMHYSDLTGVVGVHMCRSTDSVADESAVELGYFIA